MEQQESMPLNVPPIVAEYLEAERAKDARRLWLCFDGNGVVHDESKDRRGREAIREWKEEVDAKYKYVWEPLAAAADENTVMLRATLAGDFPGSPVEVNQVFTVEGGKIVSREIRS